MKRIVALIACGFFVCQTGFSQDIKLSPTVISSAGNYAEGANISLSWTLGEVAVTTLNGGDLILTQGFQQPFTNSVGIEPNPIKWQISAFPNPVDQELRLRFELPETTDFILEIQDVSGKLISQEEYKQVYAGDIIPVNMSSYQAGVYFFRISTTDRQQVRVISIRKE